MASDVRTASGSLTATNQTVAKLGYANGALSLFLGGTWTGTVQLKALPNIASGGGTTEAIIPLGMTSANLTTAGLYVFPYIAGDFEFQVSSSGTWTGTANVVLSAGPRN
jgi:hypothetical protein